MERISLLPNHPILSALNKRFQTEITSHRLDIAQLTPDVWTIMPRSVSIELDEDDGRFNAEYNKNRLSG